MSLLRLLTAGKSLVGGAHTIGSRYRAAAEGSLPKFGAKKNPFRGTVKAGAVVQAEEICSPAAASECPERTEGERPEAKTSGGGQESVSAEPARLKPGTIAVGRSGAGWRDRGVRGFKSWIEVKNWLGWRPPAAKPGGQRATKALVQAELSLDSIKVVRNDLSDSDLEVVPLRASTKAATARAISNEPSEPAPVSPAGVVKPELSESAWNRVSARFFGAGKL